MVGAACASVQVVQHGPTWETLDDHRYEEDVAQDISREHCGGAARSDQASSRWWHDGDVDAECEAEWRAPTYGHSLRRAEAERVGRPKVRRDYQDEEAAQGRLSGGCTPSDRAWHGQS